MICELSHILNPTYNNYFMYKHFINYGI